MTVIFSSFLATLAVTLDVECHCRLHCDPVNAK